METGNPWPENKGRTSWALYVLTLPAPPSQDGNMSPWKLEQAPFIYLFMPANELDLAPTHRHRLLPGAHIASIIRRGYVGALEVPIFLHFYTASQSLFVDQFLSSRLSLLIPYTISQIPGCCGYRFLFTESVPAGTGTTWPVTRLGCQRVIFLSKKRPYMVRWECQH